MEPTQDELRTQYSLWNDRALLELAAEPEALTPAAFAALLQELEARHLEPPPAPAASSAAAQPEAWVTIERFRDLSAGIVARGALEAAEIPCLLRDENTVRLDWQISNLIGGMRLQVLAGDEASARALLQQLPSAATHTEPISALDPGERCPSCGSADIHRVEPGMGLRLAALFLAAIPLPRGKRVWRCASCGRESAEEDLRIDADPSAPSPPTS